MGAPRIYFAHPENTYGTKLELECVQAVYAHYKGQIALVNPSDQEHQDRAAKIKHFHGSGGATDYFDDLAGTCACGIGLMFRDGMLATCVFRKLERIAENRNPILLIDQYVNIISTSIEKIIPLELSISATRARIRLPDGSTRPY